MLNKELILRLCDELGLQAAVFYGWQKKFYENRASAFEHNALKGVFIPTGTRLPLDDSRRLVEGDIEHYNNDWLNSAIGCITPKDKLAGQQENKGGFFESKPMDE